VKRLSLLTIVLLVCLILFRNNILIFFNNVYNMFFLRNGYENAEISLLAEKVRYLESEYDKLNDFKENLPIYADYDYVVTRIIYRENYFYNARVLIEVVKI